MSRVEILLNALLTDESVNIEPQSRLEEYLLALIQGKKDVIEPQSRAEAYLYALCQKGMSGGGEVLLQDKTVTENGTYTPDEGFDGFGSVTVDVSGSGGGAGVGVSVWAPMAKNGTFYMGETVSVSADSMEGCDYIESPTDEYRAVIDGIEYTFGLSSGEAILGNVRVSILYTGFIKIGKADIDAPNFEITLKLERRVE